MKKHVRYYLVTTEESASMKYQVLRLEKKFGDLDKNYWPEGKGKFYSGVDLSCSILGNVATVLRNGAVEMR